MRLSVLAFIVLVMAEIMEAFGRNACLNHCNSRWKAVVGIRGGGGLLNPQNTAKTATFVLGLQGSHAALAPTKVNEIFGIEPNPLDDFLLKRFSMLIISFALLTRELVFQKSGLLKAVGISSIPVTVELIQPLLNNDGEKLGFLALPQYILFALYSTVVYACLTGAPYANNLVKFLTIFNIVAGSISSLFPKEAFQSFGGRTAVGTSTKLLLRGVYVMHLSQGILMTCFNWNNKIDAVKALGYSWIPFLMYSVSTLFISKEAEELQMRKVPVYFWLAMNAAVVASLCF